MYISRDADGRTKVIEAHPELLSDSSHDVQHFCITRSGNIRVVIAENRIEKRRYEIIVNRLKIFSFLDVCLHELENLLLHGP